MVLGSVSRACLSLKLIRRFEVCFAAGRGGLSRGFLWFAPGRLANQVRAALRQHVAVAPGIFGPAALAFRHHDAADEPIEKIAVVADEEDGPGIVAKDILEDVERLHVEIVGRLIEDEQVRWLCQHLRQHQAAAFPA